MKNKLTKEEKRNNNQKLQNTIVVNRYWRTIGNLMWRVPIDRTNNKF